MSYNPISPDLFVAAYAGAMAGMGASNRIPINADAAKHVGLSNIAGAWAQEFDTLFNNATADGLQTKLAQELSEAVWAQRSPNLAILPTSTIPATYSSTVSILLAVIQAAENYYSAQGITPPTAGTPPAGANTYLQYNNSGKFGGAPLGIPFESFGGSISAADNATAFATAIASMTVLAGLGTPVCLLLGVGTYTILSGTYAVPRGAIQGKGRDLSILAFTANTTFLTMAGALTTLQGLSIIGTGGAGSQLLVSTTAGDQFFDNVTLNSSADVACRIGGTSVGRMVDSHAVGVLASFQLRSSGAWLISNTTYSGPVVGVATSKCRFANCRDTTGSQITLDATSSLAMQAGRWEVNPPAPAITAGGSLLLDWETLTSDGLGRPANLASLVRNTFTFATDADATLSQQQALAEILNITTGAQAATRAITNPLTAVSQNSCVQRVTNNSAFSVTYKFASGTGVTVPSLFWCDITSDGTNAIVTAFGSLTPAAPEKTQRIKPSIAHSLATSTTGSPVNSTTGVKFLSLYALKVGGVRFACSNAGRSIKVSLWDVATTVRVATATLAAASVIGVNEVLFASPFTITPGKTYMVTIYDTSGTAYYLALGSPNSFLPNTGTLFFAQATPINFSDNVDLLYLGTGWLGSADVLPTAHNTEFYGIDPIIL